MARTQEYLVAFILFSTFWLALLGYAGTLKSGFHLVDDHEIIGIGRDLLQRNSLLQTLKEWISFDLTRRFRPFYYTHRVVETYVFGTDFFKWELYTGLLACFTSLFLYISSRQIALTRTESVLLVLLTLVGPQSMIWWSLGPSETIGMFAFAASLVLHAIAAGSKKNACIQLAAILFSILSSLSKESFIITIPAVLLLRMWISKELLQVSWGKALKHNRITIGVLTIIALVELSYIVLFVGTEKIGYAGVTRFSIGRFTDAFLAIARTNHVAGCSISLLVLALLISSGKERERISGIRDFLKPQWMPLVIAAAVVTPQCVLYAKSGMTPRYLLPALFGYSFLLTVVMTWIRKKSLISRPLYAGIVLFLLLVVVHAVVRQVIPAAARFSVEGRNTNELIGHVRDETTPQSRIMIVADPALHYEETYSLSQYLQIAAGRPDVEIDMIRSRGSYSAFQTDLIRRFKESFPGQAIFENQENVTADCIIIFRGLEKFVTKLHRIRIDHESHRRSDFKIAVCYCKKSKGS